MFCKLCNVKFNSKKDETEHGWSLLHHRKLFRAEGRDAEHNCNLCDETSESFALFTKHINSDKHRSLMTKWIRLDAADTSDSDKEAIRDKQESRNQLQTKQTPSPHKREKFRKKIEKYIKDIEHRHHAPSQFYWSSQQSQLRPAPNHPRSTESHADLKYKVLQPHVRKRFLNRQQQPTFQPPQMRLPPSNLRPVQFSLQDNSTIRSPLVVTTSNLTGLNDNVQALTNFQNNSEKNSVRAPMGFPMFTGNSSNTDNDGGGESTETDFTEEENERTTQPVPSIDNPNEEKTVEEIVENNDEKFVSSSGTVSSCPSTMNIQLSKEDNDKGEKSTLLDFPNISLSQSIPIVREANDELKNDNIDKAKKDINKLSELRTSDDSEDDNIPLATFSQLNKSKNRNEVPKTISSTTAQPVETTSTMNTEKNSQTTANPSSSDISSDDDLPPAFATPEKSKPISDSLREILERSLCDSPEKKLTQDQPDTSLMSLEETTDFSIDKPPQSTSQPALCATPDLIPLSSIDDTNELLDKLEQQEQSETESKANSLEHPKENVDNLMKKIKPISIKIRKLRPRGKTKKQKVQEEEPPLESNLPTSKQNDETNMDDAHNIDSAALQLKSTGKLKDEMVVDQKLKTCAFKKPDNTVCETLTSKKFCEYHARVLLAVEAFISTKVASNNDHPKTVSAVSLIEPEDSSSDHPQSPVSQRKRSISSCLSSENESSTNLNMSRFKRSKSNHERSISTSNTTGAVQSNNQQQSMNIPVSISTKTSLKGTRFKYLNNLSHAAYPGLTDINLANLPPTVRKLIERKARKTRSNSQSESETDVHTQEPPLEEQSNTEDDTDSGHLYLENAQTELNEKRTKEVQPPPSSPDSIRALFNLQPVGAQNKSFEKENSAISDANLIGKSLLECLGDNASNRNGKTIRGLASTPGNSFHLPSPDISRITTNSQIQQTPNEHTTKNNKGIDLDSDQNCSVPDAEMMENTNKSMDETFRTALDSTCDSSRNADLNIDLSIKANTKCSSIDSILSIRDRNSFVQGNLKSTAELHKKPSFLVYTQKSAKETAKESVHSNKQNTKASTETPKESNNSNSASEDTESLRTPRVITFSVTDNDNTSRVVARESTSNTNEVLDFPKVNITSTTTDKSIHGNAKAMAFLKQFESNVGGSAIVESMDIDKETEVEKIQTISKSTIVQPPHYDQVKKSSSSPYSVTVGQHERKSLARVDIGDTASIGQRKKKDKTKKKNNNSIPVKGSTLAELHIEENRYLLKLARVNSQLEGLKNKMSILQTTIGKYTNHIQSINEKKKKLIADINVNAQQACNTSPASTDTQSSTFSLATNNALDWSRYATPPGSPSTSSIMVDESREKRNNQVKLTKVFTKISSRVLCAKIFKNLVFVGCDKPNCAVYVKDLKNSNESPSPRKITSSARPVTCMEVMSFENDSINLCTGCVGGTVTLYHTNVKTNVWTVDKKFKFGSGGCLSMHFGFDRLFVGFLDGTIHQISKNWQRKDTYDLIKFKRMGKKRRGITCISSASVDGKIVLFLSTRHGAIYTRNMCGELLAVSNDLQKVGILNFELHNNRIYALNENHTVSIFSYQHTNRGELVSIVKMNPRFAIQPMSASLAFGSLYVPDLLTAEHLFKVNLKDGEIPPNETEIHQCKRRNQIQFLERSQDKMLMALSSGDVLTFGVEA